MAEEGAVPADTGSVSALVHATIDRLSAAAMTTVNHTRSEPPSSFLGSDMRLASVPESLVRPYISALIWLPGVDSAVPGEKLAMVVHSEATHDRNDP